MRLLIDQNIPEPNYRQQSDLNPDGAAAHPFFGAKKPFINVTTTVVQSRIWWGRCYNQNQQPSGVMLHWANGCGFWSINYFHKNMIAWSEWARVYFICICIMIMILQMSDSEVIT